MLPNNKHRNSKGAAKHPRIFQGGYHTGRRGDTKAVIDIGSNSIKLRVVRKQGNVLRTLLDTTEVVRLGKGLVSGYLEEATLKHGVGVVRRLVRLAADMGAKPRLVATMALRVARNAGEFVRLVRERTGITIEILSGEEEARLAWLGAIHGLGVAVGFENRAVFDTGGGSTEFIFGSGSQIAKSRSVPIGAVRLTEKFFDADPVTPGSVEQAVEYVESLFVAEGLTEKKQSPLSVIGLGGGVVAIASVKLRLASLMPEKINGTLLTRAEIDAQVKLYASCTLAERMNIVGLPPKRADIVLASACIVQCALKILETDSFRVSINGLRHGLLVEMFEGRKCAMLTP